jgi:hypothetical protein
MRTVTIFFIAILFSGTSQAQKPTTKDITSALKSTWENPQGPNREKNTVTINSIKLGTSEKSGSKHHFEGVPKGALVTNAKIDFIQNKFYSNETQHVRRIMTAWVFKDQFGDWKVMNVGVVYPGN